MGKRLVYIGYFLKNAPSSLFERLFHKPKQIKKFRGTKNITTKSSGEVLAEMINKGEPFAAIRFGATEIGCLNNHEKISLGFRKTYKDKVRWAMKVRGGYYPTTDEYLNKYAEIFAELAPNIDILAISGIHMEDYFAKRYCPNATIISNWGMEPLLGEWTYALKGKKVLVITPFVDEVKSQYEKRGHLFPKNDLLPDFDLKLIKAPVTLGNDKEFEVESSIEYIRILEEEIKNTDFDIALIGAGAYGSILTMYCRSIGKMAIQSGGATQTLFGIIGKRWENRQHVAKYVNEYWVRPNSKPDGFEQVDNGAYW